ncbi:MAG: low molecular weight protein arginine phosphatase [Lentisphaerae bacterium]|nr:low molecular weight protein arginine phosphatase [Lentisphaerota bacterium]
MDDFPENDIAEMQVLFICTGNTCRSPLAQYCFEQLSGGRFRSVSAGLYAFDGEAMSRNSLAVLEENGINAASFRSQSVTFDLVRSSTLILTMCDSHRRELLMRYPQAAEKCALLRHFSGGGDVPDPFGQSLAVYRETFAEIKSALEKWMEFFNNKFEDEPSEKKGKVNERDH